MMKLNRSLYAILLGVGLIWVWVPETAQAQQESVFSQYMFNRLMINPAYAGTKGRVSLTALYRHQWAGIEGAPRTFNIGVHGANVNRRHGFGAVLLHDRIGAFQVSLAALNYAFRIPLNDEKTTFLALGLQLGGIQYSLDREDIVTPPGVTDPVFSSNENDLLPDVGTGFFFHTPRFYLGGSVAHLIESRIDLFANEDARLNRQFFLTSGYDISLDRRDNDFILTPSTLVRLSEHVPVQFDLNLNLMMIQKFWIGAGARLGFGEEVGDASTFDDLGDALVLMAGFYPIPQLRIGYAYDYALSDLQTHQSGTHEIMLSFDFGKSDRARTVTPRYF